MRLGDFLNTKSNSPVKRRQLYEAPAKVDKPKIVLKFTYEKKEIQPKLFQPKDIITIEKGGHKSVPKLGSNLEKNG